MTSVNMFEAKTDLSRLVKMLEAKEEDVIYIARNGVWVAQLTLIPEANSSKRIGAAAGKFTVPANFDDMDREIEDMFEGYL